MIPDKIDMIGEIMADEKSSIPALKVNQWMDSWDSLDYDEDNFRARPDPYYFVTSLPALMLKNLSDIRRRDRARAVSGVKNTNIQRAHDSSRSDEIRRFVEGGYPWSSLTQAKRNSGQYDQLRKPGWLPTAVVVNVLRPGDLRDGKRHRQSDSIELKETKEKSIFSLVLPKSPRAEWEMAPIEVIDGQHRLLAFDTDDTLTGQYELPVVVFYGLDVSWQAYLFWTINIKPKKINPSLAFDLYPLLREQDWLTSGEDLPAYKDSRAQELTEFLWSTPSSPWYRRINMLGGARAQNGRVTQAAFIRGLTSAIVKAWKAPRSPVGGLFGGSSDGGTGLGWNRVQQSALIIYGWRALADAVHETTLPWAVALRESGDAVSPHFGGVEDAIAKDSADDAFAGAMSLLAHDQGVRAFHNILNDILYVAADDLGLRDWVFETELDEPQVVDVEAAISEIEALKVGDLIREIADCLARFDWRSSAAPGLSELDKAFKSGLRGSGGYRDLRVALLRHMSECGGAIAGHAHEVTARLKF